MGLFRTLLSGLAAIVMATCVAMPVRAADTFRKLKDAEIRAKLSGMEITDEVHWAELYHRDGTFTVWSMARKTTGKWIVKGGELCLDNGRETAECKEVWLSGSKIEFRRPGGVVFEGVLKKQQPRT